MRLAKFLAHGGVASRRIAEKLVAAGRVTVGGEVVTDPARDVGERETCGSTAAWSRVRRARSGRSTSRPASSRPPRSRARGRRWSAWSRAKRRLYPVGRLDADSTGLLLLTNDGELANRLTHPRYEVPKAYRVQLRRAPATPTCAASPRASSSRTARPRRRGVRRLGEREIEIVLREGRNRQVRRMAEAIGNRVDSLRRVRFGPIELGDLGEGNARRLDGTRSRALAPAARSTVEAAETLSHAGFGKMGCGRSRLFAVRGAVQAEANDAGCDPRRDLGADARAARRNELERRRRWSAASSRRPRTSTPSSRPSPRARIGLDSVPLLCGREIPVPGSMERVIRVHGPLLRAGGHEPRRTSTSARPRSCAPTSTRHNRAAMSRHLRREARPHPGLPGRRADRAGAGGDRRRRDRPARLERVAVPAAPEGDRGDRARRRAR